MDNSLLHYYWFKSSKINLDDLIELEVNAFKHAFKSNWKLFKAHKFSTLEYEREVTILGKN